MLYPASLIVIGLVAAIVLGWAAVMVWAMRSGQLAGIERTRRRPLEEEEQEGGPPGDR